MEKFKGTPGPWVVYRGEVLTVDYEYDGQTMCDHICNCEEINGESPNANLTAAAPDLLEALQELIKGYEGKSNSGMFDMVCHGDEIGKANAAIDRALGKNDGEE